MKLAYAVLPVVLAICGCGSEREAPTEQASASADAPTLDSRPIVGSLKPPVDKLATPGGRVKQLETGKGTIRVGLKMVEVFDLLPDPAVEDSENDDYVLVTDRGTFPGLKYVYRYVLSDGRRIVVRYSRRLPNRPFRIVSDNSPGAGDRQNKEYPYLIEEIVVE